MSRTPHRVASSPTGIRARQLAAWVEEGGVLLRFAGPRLANGQDDLVPVDLRRGDRNGTNGNQHRKERAENHVALLKDCGFQKKNSGGRLSADLVHGPFGLMKTSLADAVRRSLRGHALPHKQSQVVVTGAAAKQPAAKTAAKKAAKKR